MPTFATFPQMFGHFRVLRKLGEGGMGAVYLAEDTRLGCQVALKIPQIREDDGLKLIERFHREARLAQSVHHPYICPVYEVADIAGVHYLTMPIIDGPPLSRLVGPEQPWKQREAAELVRRLALALQALHERKVIHRDLKPHNIMVRAGGEPMLMDFGLACALGGEGPRLTTTGKALGTPAYMPPELVTGDDKALSPATDVYGLGVILFELLTGRLPFEAADLRVLFYQILMVAPPTPSTLRADLDRALEAVCLKTLAKGPGERHAGMTELAADLDAYLGRGAASVSLPVGGLAPGLIPAEMLSEELRVACPQCGRRLKVPPAFVGKRVRCPGCQGRFEMPADPLATPVILCGEEVLVKGLFEMPTELRATPTPIPMPVRVFPPPVLSRAASGSTPPPLPISVREQGALPGPRPAGHGSTPPPLPISVRESPTGAPAAPKPRQPGDILSNALGMELAWIPAGSFLMGYPADETARLAIETQHRVTLTKGFLVGVYLVTQAQWRAVMGDNPSYFEGDDRPVEMVSWEDCQEFCKQLNLKAGRAAYRLPTEAEWEYACRAGTTTPFSFGETVSPEQVNYDGHHPYGKGRKGQYRQQTTPVGSFPANAWGLYDMHGNVWEWCQDWYGPYPQNNSTDPQGSINGKARVLRGGSWVDGASYCHAAYRGRFEPGSRDQSFGFRVCGCLD